MCELAMRRSGSIPSNKWISVEERFPDIDGKYLVYTKQGFIHVMYYHASGEFGFEAWNVTHWMPLPEAPKMKGEK
jgi:hypothetical protein